MSIKNPPISKKEIDWAVRKILIFAGSDGHIDGHEELTKFILACLKGRGRTWIEPWVTKKEKEKRRYIREWYPAQNHKQ